MLAGRLHLQGLNFVTSGRFNEKNEDISYNHVICIIILNLVMKMSVQLARLT